MQSQLGSVGEKAMISFIQALISILKELTLHSNGFNPIAFIMELEALNLNCHPPNLIVHIPKHKARSTDNLEVATSGFPYAVKPSHVVRCPRVMTSWLSESTKAGMETAEVGLLFTLL